MTNKMNPALDDQWDYLRSNDFMETGEEVIRCSVRDLSMDIESITHVRTGHYASYKVETNEGDFLVRVGIVSEDDNRENDNSGYLGTSTFSPSGQSREHMITFLLSEAGASVADPSHYTKVEVSGWDAIYDTLWLPYLEADNTPLTAEQWRDVLVPLHNADLGELPVFTNREKTLARLDKLPNRGQAGYFLEEYDALLEKLFSVATKWSPVHGDAHCGNAFLYAGEPILFDFDTVCWAPSVWDLTHLLYRVGTDRNTGYTAEELTAVFNFSAEETAAALELRALASTIAREYSRTR